MTITEQFFRTEIMPCHKAMYRLAYMILENEDDASDAVQMAMTRIWEHRDSMPEIGNPTAYCISAARYAAIDIARSRKPSDRLPDADTLASSDSIDERLEKGQELSTVKRIMRQLPENQQRVLSLSAFSECSNTEIAQITGLSDANVRTLLSRARTKLKLLYSQQQ